MTATLSPPVQTWGARFLSAFRHARRHFGMDQVTYEKVAERVRFVLPACAGTSIQRLAELKDEPTKADQRVRAFFALMAMGYDPADFGMTTENTPVNGFDMERALRLLPPVSRRYSRGETLRPPAPLRDRVA